MFWAAGFLTHYAPLYTNRILHNTQWIVGPHVHVAILVGLTMTLYSAIYLLFPGLKGVIGIFMPATADTQEQALAVAQGLQSSWPLAGSGDPASRSFATHGAVSARTPLSRG